MAVGICSEIMESDKVNILHSSHLPRTVSINKRTSNEQLIVLSIAFRGHLIVQNRHSREEYREPLGVNSNFSFFGK